ncbi:hypothetical protein HME9304_03255 [Flagellimonas maritima]|uniref:Uncharacterized protein n=1 Tax=Flagellimonas maritima TaxID=1383885 RepID=A0A2Z4LWY4_9FLAO|nr:hypothetical protein HME9304_03255 [Allomuricauda aurantiaca]
MNSIKKINVPKRPDFLERTRHKVLTFGYDYVIFKSKVKKYLASSKEQLTSIHP